MYDMNECVERVLFSADTIQDIVSRLGRQISEDYKGKKLFLLGLLKGSINFMAELMKYIEIPCIIDFMTVSSYLGGTESTGRVNIIHDMTQNCKDMDVLIIEDIVDSGNTLSFVSEYIKLMGCNSVEIATLLDKPSRRKKQVPVKYSGKVIDDLFVVGFGLDYDEYYRNLPYIGVLKESVYE